MTIEGQGTDVTGAVQPAGGQGMRGWLSSLWLSGFQMKDGTGTTQRVTVGQQHNSDFQVPPATGGALLTAGVPQLQNPAGLQDRQRSAGQDNIAALGLTASAANFAQAVGPYTIGTAITVGQGTPAAPVTLTPSSMVNVLAGAVVVIDTGANQESAVVVSSTATTISVVFAPSTPNGTSAGARFAHASTAALTTFVFNQERDASGELSGASGKGTAVAAEYEFNGGGPVLASGLASGLQFDRANSLQGKGRTTAPITTTTAGAASLAFASAAATNLLQPGSQVYLSVGTGNVVEVVYTSTAWVPGSSATVPLVSPVVNAGSTQAAFGTYSGAGPRLNGFYADGVGIEEEALYDPVSDLFYIERAATQDNMPAVNIVAENEVLWNGTGMDRARSNLAVTLLASAAQTATYTSPDQLNVNGHALHVILDATAIGTANLLVTINAKDPASGKYYPLLTGASVITNSTNVYRVGPALTAAANAVANDWVPRTFQVVVTQGGTGAATYSLGYNLSE